MGDPVVINDLLCFLTSQRVLWSKELLVTVVKRHFPLDTIAESVRILRLRISGEEADRLALDTPKTEVDCNECRAVRLIEALLALLDLCDKSGRPLPSFGTTSPTSLPQLASLKEENGVISHLVEEIRSLKMILLTGPVGGPATLACHQCVRLFPSRLKEELRVDTMMSQSSPKSPTSCHESSVMEPHTSPSAGNRKSLISAVQRLSDANAEPKSSDISNPSSPENLSDNQSDSDTLGHESPNVGLDLRIKLAVDCKQPSFPSTIPGQQAFECPSLNDLLAAYDIPAEPLKPESGMDEPQEDCRNKNFATPAVTPKPSPMESQLSNSGTSATASPEEFGGDLPSATAAKFVTSHLVANSSPFPRLDNRMPSSTESSPMTTPTSPFLLMPNITTVFNAVKAAGLFGAHRPFDPSGHNPMTLNLPTPFLQNFQHFFSGQHITPPVSANRGPRRRKPKLRPPSQVSAEEELEPNDVENTSLTPNTTKTGSDVDDNEVEEEDQTDFMNGSADDSEAFKPFVCNHSNCSKRFANKFLLKKHEFIHTGERPHQCPYCGKRFNRKDNLLRHKKTHIANFGGGARKRSVFGVIDKSVVKCVASLHGDTDSPPSTETVTTASLAGDLE